jgi:hypothetical protein
MTFDFAVALKEIIKKELKISHFKIDLSVGKMGKIVGKYKNLIVKQFGSTFLSDANYVIFFKGAALTKQDTKKLLDILNRAFGGKIAVGASELHKIDLAEQFDESDVDELDSDNIEQDDIDTDDVDTDDLTAEPVVDYHKNPKSAVYFIKLTLK